MATKDHSSEKINELSFALTQQGLVDKTMRFLTSQGIGNREIADRGGWMMVLLEMIPEKYPDVSSLIEAIQKV
jgi:hypothetical protein